MQQVIIITAFLFLTGTRPQQRVVFGGSKDGKQHLYVINLDGTGLKQITTSPAEDMFAAWSPDGSTIVFARVPGHKKNESRSDGHLWIVKANGTDLIRLTSGKVFDSEPVWSIDGKRITFKRQGTLPIPRRLEIDVATKQIREQSPRPWSFSKSPDGKWIAYLRSETAREDEHRSDLWLTTSFSKRGQRLTNFKSGVGEPMWSPDGKDILFSVETHSPQDSRYKLCMVSLKSHKIRTLLSSHYIEDPRWSPDGKRICFMESKYRREPMTNESFRQLYVMAADGSGKLRLTNHWLDDYSPQWTRDGKFIVIQGERGMSSVGGAGVTGERSSHLIVVDASGKGERIIPTGVEVYSPVLSP